MARIITVLFSLLTLVVMALTVKIHYEAHQFVSPIMLADDASTPEQKSKFLGEFLEDAEKVNFTEYSTPFMYTKRDKISNQLDVIRSLKKRCDDLSVLDRSTMGYAQGMTQITGQEFDHAIVGPVEVLKEGHIRSGWGYFGICSRTLTILMFLLCLSVMGILYFTGKERLRIRL